MEESIVRFGICFQFASEHDFSKLIIQQHVTTTNISLSLINTTTTTGLTNAKAITINSVIIFAMAIFVTILNMALIFGIVKTTRPTITLSKALYIYVSCVDIMYGALINIFFIILILNSQRNCTSQSIGLAVSMLAMGLGVSTFVLISIIPESSKISLVKRSLVCTYLVAFICIFIECFNVLGI